MFTPTEQRIMDVLNDELPHTRDELLKCLEDSVATAKNLHPHLSGIRGKIAFIGQTIASSSDNGIFYYRLARKVAPVSRE